MKVQPYLFYNGRCEEALEFYRKALGAETTALMRWKENPDPQARSLPQDKVMHASFRVGDSEVLASDGMADGKPGFQGFSLTVTVPDGAAAERAFKALADGGQVQHPLMKTFFSSHFGMLADRFGVQWMVMAETQGS